MDNNEQEQWHIIHEAIVELESLNNIKFNHKSWNIIRAMNKKITELHQEAFDEYLFDAKCDAEDRDRE